MSAKSLIAAMGLVVVVLTAIEYGPQLNITDGKHCYLVTSTGDRLVAHREVDWTEWEPGQQLLDVWVKDGRVSRGQLHTVVDNGGALGMDDIREVPPEKAAEIIGLPH